MRPSIDSETGGQASPEFTHNTSFRQSDFGLLVTSSPSGTVFIGTDTQLLGKGLIEPDWLPKRIAGNVTIEQVADGLVQCTRLEEGHLLLTMPTTESRKRDESFITFLSSMVAASAFWCSVLKYDREQLGDEE